MELHIPTMLLMVMASSATLAVSLAAGASRHRKDGVLLWAMAFTAHTLAFVLFGLRGRISDMASVIVGNALLSATFVLLAQGLYQFQRRKPPTRWLWFPVVLVSVSFLFLLDNFAARVVLGGMVFAGQVAFLLFLLGQKRASTVGRGQYFVAFGLWLDIAMLISRVVLTAIGQAEMVAMMASNTVQSITYLCSMVAHLLVGIGLIVMAKDHADEQNHVLATLDPLTGLANRRKMQEVLEQEWARALRSGHPLALIMLDVDWFKKFNDHYGHQAGDDCLAKVAAALRQTVQRSGDLAARYGGEEFLIILPNTQAHAALALGQALCRAVLALNMAHTQSALGAVTVSAGVAVLSPQRHKTLQDLISAADAALYRAKQNGRNQAQAE